MIWLSPDGYFVEETAKITPQSDDTVRYWLHRLQHAGCSGLIEAPPSGRPPEITRGIETFLHAGIPQSPRRFKMDRPGWTPARLAQLVQRRFKVQVTDEGIRQHLARVEAVCRRPTWTVKHLAEPPPGDAQKKGLFHACYSTLRAGRMGMGTMKPK